MNPDQIVWNIKKFKDLSNTELYEILKLRTDVFVVEQNCPYPELDGKDDQAIHLMGLTDSKLNMYCRIFFGTTGNDGRIGRVVVHKSFRSRGLGLVLMNKAIDILIEHGVRVINISAQSHLQQFYEKLDFIKISDVYLLDDIPHIDMERILS